MKKLILFFLIASLVSCGGKNSNSPKNPADDDFILEGTVVKIFNLLIPRAEAADTNFAALLGGVEESASLPPEVIGKDCTAIRCAFLLDTGVRQGDPDSRISIKLLAITPIVGGKFVFAMNKSLNPLYQGNGNSGQNPLFNGRSVIKVVVRGWNPITKMPLAKSPQDREMVLGPQEIEQYVGKPQSSPVKIDVTPESTVQARRRVEVLKSNVMEDSESFFETVKELFGNATENIRDIALRCVESLMGPESDEKDLLDLLQKSDRTMTHSDSFKPQGMFISLKQKYSQTPISTMSVSDVLIELDMLNVQIQAARMGQKNQMARYPIEKLIHDAIVVSHVVLELKALKIQLDGQVKKVDTALQKPSLWLQNLK